MSRVILVDAKGMAVENTVVNKLQRLIQESGAVDDLSEGMRVAIKVNTSEAGYEYGLRPVFIRAVTDVARNTSKTRPTICDGLRLVDYWQKANANNFLNLAREKGYSNDTLGGNFVVIGGFSGDEGELYPCELPDSELGGVEVGTAVCRSDALWVLSHVTLHPLFGLSGALLNGGFDCLIARAKSRVLNGVDPYPFNGQRPPLEKLRAFHRRALESLLGVRAAMDGRIFYVNYLWDITPQPEYFPFSGEPVTGNLGFLASRDPVALDAATFDLIRESHSFAKTGVDSVREIGEVDFAKVLKDAETMGVGCAEGALKRLS